MIRIRLTQEEKVALTRLRLEKNSNIGEHAYFVLLSNEGHSPPRIAKRLGHNIITVRLWLNRYKESGIKGLINKKQPGRPAKKAPLIEEHFKIILEKSPEEYGYQEPGWRINILSDWLRRNGCIASYETIAKQLRRLGYSYKRFSKTLPKNIPSHEEKNKEILSIINEINNKNTEECEIFFEDESHFSNQPYVNRGWFKVGKKKR